MVCQALIGTGLVLFLNFNLSAQLVPVDVRTIVNGFQDDFDGTALGPNWVVSGANVFSAGSGFLHVTSASGDPNHLLYELPGYSNTVQEVLARIRIVNFGTGDAARAGVAVGVDPVSSQGINYLFRTSSSEGQTGNHTAFLDDARAWGPGQNFVWQTNVWYWMRLRQEPNAVSQGGVNDVFAKIWLADGSVAEPANWQLVWDYTPSRSTRTGYAGITASSLGGLAEFDVDYILIKAGGLPSIYVSPSAFVFTPVAITNQPQSQTVAELSPVTFSVGANGNPAPTYQWYKNNAAIAGALNASYTIPAASYGDNNAQFKVVAQNVVSNVTYSVTSSVATLTVVPDTTVPTVSELIPATGSTMPSLTEIEVHFSEGVQGVDAGDLLINGAPATNLTAWAADVYVFDFPQPTNGPVQVTWSSTNSITDLAFNPNPFAGGSYSYTLNPSAPPTDVFISEFMASNKHTIRDEDGNYSDWIEIYNRSPELVDLSGWYLTDDSSALTKWQIPSGVMLSSKSYLLIWASGNDRTDPTAPLHTNFKLDASGGFLALVYSNGVSIVSSFAPYPQQYEDVSYGCDRLDPSLVGYFTNATPGDANSILGPGFGPAIQFSVASCTFRQPFTLTLSLAGSNAVIRYFLVTNGTTAAMTGVPDTNSPIYTGPLTISNSIQVRARAFPTQTNYFPGPPHNEAYFQLDASVTNFSSNIPIIVFHDMGQGAVAATADQFMTMQVFDTLTGRAALTNAPDLAVQGTFHRRGQATFWNPKTNLRVETQDEFGDNLNVPLAGLPSENDWVFYGIDDYDKALMHNPLTHELYRELGHYTSRTRFVEVYLKDDSGAPGPITTADYNGLYVLEEKIKIDKNRVDIDKLEPENTNAPSVTGGYLLSIDKANPGYPMSVAGVSIWNLNPDYYDLLTRPTQQQYIYNYFNSFYAALYSPNWTNAVTGYAPYMDMSSWIDYHLHQTLVFNVDALRISAYFYKPRSGSIVQGPLWDFDRCFGTRTSDDGRGFNPRLWRSAEMDGGTDMFNAGNTFNNPWYGRLFTDPDFWQRWIDRYQELRNSTYSLSNLMAQIDYFGNQVREATTREYPRWAGSGASDTTPRSGPVTADGMTYTFPTPGTWQGEIDFTKWWFSNRVDFMDTNFLNPPAFSSSGGGILPGFPLTITAATRETNSIIYYTLDGTDPRLPGGGISPAALSSLNTATITLNTNARVFARNFNAAHNNLTGAGGNPPLSSHWSGPTVATFTTVGSSPFVAGNLVVLRLGNGTQSLSSHGNSVFVDQFTPNGAFIGSIAIPDNDTNALIISGSANSEGALTLSADGRLLTLAGYHIAQTNSSSSLANSSSANVPRALGVVDMTGGFALVGIATNQYSANNIRSGTTDGRGNYWGAGANSGTYYFGSGAPATVQNTVANTLVIQNIGRNLCFSTSKSTPGIWQIPGTPTSGPVTPAVLLSTGAGSSPYAFAFNANFTTAYVADDTLAGSGGVQRWDFDGSAWSLTYVFSGLAGVGARGVAADFSGAQPVIYATTAESPPNRLVSITDTGASSAVTTLATAGINQVFHGVSFAPKGSSSPQFLAMHKGAGGFTFAWTALLNQPYKVQYIDDLSRTNWTTLTNVVATSPVLTVTDISATTGTNRFYRVVLGP
jgi:CotH protein/lamin tail-like protein/Ig-like domain-containing protein/chitobiase/beta-hexosaminidase-like protein